MMKDSPASKGTLLVNPPIADISTTPFYVMPPGLLSVAAFLKRAGEPAWVLDLNVSKRKMAASADLPSAMIMDYADKLQNYRPSLVGVSVMVAGQMDYARMVLQQTKKMFPETVTIVGGAHVSQFPREILENCPEIDFVALGEGENQALECARFARTGIRPDTWPDGIAFREQGEVVVIPKTTWIADINLLPDPAFEQVTFSDYRHDVSSWHNPYQTDFGVRVPLITSRGCPNACNFCSLQGCMGRAYRPLPALRVVQMIQTLYEEHGIAYFAIFDANFAEDVGRVLDICDEIAKRNLKISLDMPTGLPISKASRTMIDALAGVGLIRTCISVESGDQIIRNQVMLKNIEEEEIFNVANAIRQYPQIFLLTDFVLGMPEDTEKSVAASTQLIEKLDIDDISLTIATPYPGTQLYEQCLRDQLFFDPEDVREFWHLNKYSHNNVHDFVIKPYHLGREELNRQRDQILDLRRGKQEGYKKRMDKYFPAK